MGKFTSTVGQYMDKLDAQYDELQRLLTEGREILDYVQTKATQDAEAQNTARMLERVLSGVNDSLVELTGLSLEYMKIETGNDEDEGGDREGN